MYLRHALIRQSGTWVGGENVPDIYNIGYEWQKL